MVTQDMGSFVAAAPLRAANRTAHMCDRATVYERKEPEDPDPELAQRAHRRR